MPRKSPAANNPPAVVKTPVTEKVFKVTKVNFSSAVRIEGYPGAHTSARVGEEQGYGTNTAWVKSLVVVGDKLCIDGTYWMPLSAGLVAGWVY